MTKHLLQSKNKGFTLIETLVALTILIIGVTSAFTAASQGISSATLAKDQVIAFNLVQEGMEMVRNTRDTNGLQGLNWLHGMSENASDPCYFSDINGPGKSCYRDITTNSFSSCSNVGSCPVLRENTSTGFYTYTASDPATIYTREIHLASINTHEVAVTVTVTWTKGIIARKFTARENIFDWQS